MTIVLSNLRYADPANTSIDMDVSGWFDGETIPFLYHPDDAAPLTGEVKALLAAGSYQIAAYAVPALTTDELVAYANAKQWAVATGGRAIVVNGAPIAFATTMDSMELMSGKVQRLDQPEPPATVNWQTGPTSFTSIDAATFKSIATELAEFFQATFDALPGIFAGISAGTITTKAQIDAVLTAI